MSKTVEIASVNIQLRHFQQFVIKCISYRLQRLHRGATATIMGASESGVQCTVAHIFVGPCPLPGHV